MRLTGSCEIRREDFYSFRKWYPLFSQQSASINLCSLPVKRPENKGQTPESSFHNCEEGVNPDLKINLTFCH